MKHLAKSPLYTLLCYVLFGSLRSNAQMTDSIKASVGLNTYFSSAGYQPFWLVSNRFGTVVDRKNDLSTYARISNKHVLGETEYQDDQGLYNSNEFALSYGLTLYNNNHFKSLLLEEAYVRLGYKNWALRAGRFEEVIGVLDPELSSGSLGVSPNALPVPKISLAVTDFTTVPFTHGWLSFKGSFAHGWLGRDRYVPNSYYHEKTFFLRLGRGPLKLYGGVQHFAEWGGQKNENNTGSSGRQFMDVVFFNTGSGQGDNGGTSGSDHRGTIEAGGYWNGLNTDVHVYIQKPFEGRNDISPANKNMMAGWELTFKTNRVGLQKVLFEFVSSKGIDNRIPSNQVESYYNNNDYKTGWEYKGNIIGTPLFINRKRGSNYFPGLEPFDWNKGSGTIPGNANIINNRIVALHAGAMYNIGEQWQGKTLFTYTVNYGNINSTVIFPSKKRQVYSLQQLSYDLPRTDVRLKAAVGFDTGDFSSIVVAGGMLGVEWNITAHSNTNNHY